MTVNRTARQLTTVAVVALVAAVALGTAFLLTPEFLESDWLAYGLCAAIILTAVVPCVIKIRRGTIDFADVSIMFLFTYVMHFGIGPIQAIANGSTFLGTFGKDMPVPAPFLEAQALLFLGLVAFWIGYQTRYGAAVAARFRPLPATWDSKKLIPISLVFIVLGLGARAARFIATAGSLSAWFVGNKDDFLNNAAGAAYLASFEAAISVGLIALFIGGRIYRSTACWVAFFSVGFVEFALRFIEGSRSALAFLILELIVAGYMLGNRGKREQRRLMTSAAFAVVLAAVMYPILTSLRFGGLSNPGELFKSAPEVLTPKGMAYLLTERFHGTESLALIIDKVPRVHAYDFGSHLGLIPLSILPRALWPEKPTISLGIWFGDELVPPGLFRPGASVAVTWPGEFYLSFGAVGVIVGMFLVGIFLQGLNSYFVVPRRNLSCTLVYAACLWVLLQGPEAEISMSITYGGICFVLALVFCLLMRPREAQSVRA